MLIALAMPIPEAAAEQLDRGAGCGVAVARGVDHAPGREAVLARDLVERAARRQRLERPGLGVVAAVRERRAAQIGADDRVAELGGGAGRAAHDAPADDDAAADAGADREHHEVARDEPPVVVIGLGERGAGRVVVDVHRHAEPLAQHGAQRDVLQRDVHRGADPPGRPVDDRRHRDADGGRVAGRADGRADGPRAGRSASPRCSCRSAASDGSPIVAPSSTATAIFVPPTSTPMSRSAMRPHATRCLERMPLRVRVASDGRPRADDVPQARRIAGLSAVHRHGRQGRSA